MYLSWILCYNEVGDNMWIWRLIIFIGNFILLFISCMLPSEPSKIVEATSSMPIPVSYWLMYFVVMAIVYNSLLYLFYRIKHRGEEV